MNLNNLSKFRLSFFAEVN